VTPVTVPVLPETTAALCIFLVFLVPFAIAGLSLLNTGLGRSRSAAHSMFASLCVVAVASGVYFICGFAWQGYAGMPAHTVLLSGKPWSWIGAEPFFLHRLELGGSANSLAACLGMFSVTLAALIPLGAGIDRWRISAICASTAFLAGWTYPLFAHWVWGGGWLAQLGINYGLGHGFIDAGGTSSIQVLGGLTALSIAWLLGPRRGKYSLEGMPNAIPGHNAVLVLLGCLLALLGWLGLNSAGAILFTGSGAGMTVLIAINTTLAAASAGLAAALISRVQFGRPDVSLTANGWVSGLVASSAACVFVAPAEALLIGLVGGTLTTLSVEWFELRMGIDDPGGAISVHAVSGLWGLLAVALFARFPARVMNVAGASTSIPGRGNAGQWLAQIVGIATLLGFVFPLAYGLNWALNLVCPHRVVPEGERQGLDLYELGAGAYPEFITHTEEFTQR
jgi:ammonium transporter, Amt family